MSSSRAYALSGSLLISFDPSSPGAGTVTPITGVLFSETLVGIDFRPNNGLLYGLGVNAAADTATLYVISAQTGVAGTLGVVGFFGGVDLPSSGYGFDFNPTVDRIRVTTDTGLNFRLNPDFNPLTGFIDAVIDTPIGPAFDVAGVAYTNNQPNLGGVTTLYALDSLGDVLNIQNPANAGVQNLVGTTGVDFSAVNGFDIPTGVNAPANGSPAPGNGFALLTVAGTTGFYTVNLSTGAATLVGNLLNGTTPANGLAIEQNLGARNDFNGDATSDVLWRHNSGSVSEWLMTNGQIGQNQGVATPDLAWHFQDTGDFGADGRTDILWRHDNGQAVLWQMDGPTILSNQSVATIGNDWHNEGVGDFNADRRADVLWRNDNGQVALWTMNGAQIANNQTVATVGANWHVQGLLDANGDGNSDVLLRDNGGQVVLWTMNGAQIVNNQSVANLGLDWNIQGTGDFNIDGRDDVLLRNDSGQVVLWAMDGAQILSNTSVATVSNDWHVRDVGDYNRDGRTDVLWRNDSGQVVMWEMNGVTIASNHTVTAAGGAPAPIGLDWTVLAHHYDVL